MNKFTNKATDRNGGKPPDKITQISKSELLGLKNNETRENREKIIEGIDVNIQEEDSIGEKIKNWFDS